MNASERAAAMRKAIVDKLEAHCAKHEIPVYWRIVDGLAQRATERKGYATHYIVWEPIPFLSTYLCSAYRQQREAEPDIPF